MTPEEYQIALAQRPRRNPMWTMTKDNGFMFGGSPFDSSFLNENQPFVGKNHPFNKKNPFGL
jgi:hypothetical protein